jgi:F0F1-type ATP synthase membrane subunit b/b'
MGPGRFMKKIDKFIDEAIKNIRNDRDVTRRLLDDVMIYLSKSDERHREVGITAAKYVETLQRSNEQLVKVATLLQKKESKQEGLTDNDKAEIFDLLQETSRNEQ